MEMAPRSYAHGLIASGMSAPEARRKARLFDRAARALREMTRGDSTGVRAYWVPGRIELLGKHTDYAGGRSLLCAAERGFCFVAAPGVHTTLRVRDAFQDDVLEASIKSAPTRPADPAHWPNYPITVAQRVARNFAGSLAGVDLAFASDLPRAAGLSSSSALMVGVFLALADLNDLSSRAEYLETIRSTEDLAGYLGTVENGQSFGELTGDEGVGTFGGSEDHTAILCARPGLLVQYAFCPVRFERTVPLPAGHVLVIASSGVVAEKTGGARDAYNRISQSTREILERWRAVTGRDDATLAAAAAAAPDEGLSIREALVTAGQRSVPRHLLDRLDQFVVESNEIIPAAGDALARGDLDALGSLADRSQRNAEDLLGNQVAETIHLARSARALGAPAASAFGAGFGGSVWALVRRAEAKTFIGRWAAAYAERFASAAPRAEFFVTHAGPPAAQL